MSETLEYELGRPQGRIAHYVSEKLCGSKIVKFLGEGFCGMAFLMENGQVIKVTDQDREYYMSKQLVNNKVDHVNEIYRCIAVMDEDLEEYYVIIQKYVDVEKYQGYIKWMQRNSSGVSMVKGYLREQSEDEITDRYNACINDINERFEYNERKTALMLLEHMKVMMVNLKHKLGYDADDFHYENQGWDEERQQLVMIDLGFSPVPEETERDKPLKIKVNA